MEFSNLIQQVRKSRFAVPLGMALAGALTGAGLSLLSPFEVLELKSLDARFRVASHPELADTSVVLVTIDQNSMDFFAAQKVSWPWPREFYGLLLGYLRTGGAKTVGFDFDFSSPDVDRMETDGAESDRSFADAMARSGNIVLGTNLSIREEGDQAGNPVLPRHLMQISGPGPAFDRASAPLAEFQEAAAGLGATNFETDIDDIGRRVPLLYRFGRHQIPHFGLACYAVARGVPLGKIDSLTRSIPVSDDGRMMFCWYGRGGPDGVFRYYSIHALLVSARKMQANLPPDLPPEMFRGKHVIVGGSAVGLWDFKPTPFTSIEKYPGMEIQATMLSNLLNRHFVTQPPWWVAYVFVIILSLGVSLIFFRFKNVGVAAALIVLAGALYLGLVVGSFWTYRLWLPLVGPAIGLVATFAYSAAVSYAIEGQQKRRLRKAFNRYLSPHVVADILHNVDQVELGGKTLEATAFFSDIKNFTNISEQYPPKELVAFLNDYFSLTSEVILRHEAMLDKYIGDAIMAIFGAPIPRPDHAKAACLTALEIQRVLAVMFEKNKSDKRIPVFETRIGLNTGKMVVGNIGSAQRLDYTAIGDTINLASRLEGVNKMYGTHIIISEFTYEQAKEFIEVRQLDVMRVKGKHLPVRIFELVAEKGALTQAQKEKIDLFNEGLALYRSRDFATAVKVFQNILSLDPDDHPSQTYIQRCQELMLQPLPEDWDGVYTMTTK